MIISPFRIAGLKVKAGKYEANKRIDELLVQIDGLTEIREDILSGV